MDDELLDEFVMINLIGLYTCYKNEIIDTKRMRHWLLNGKVSALLRKKGSDEVKSMFETFEETMRFESLEERKFIDFEEAFRELEVNLLQETKKAQKESSEIYYLKFEE